MTTPTIDPAFEAQLRGYCLTTAEIIYRLPDAQSLLQTYLWQDYDLAPKFPKLERFLDFWQRELDGPLHSVRIAHTQLIGPRETRTASEYLIQ
ncbi:MAG: usg protein [Pseudomonadota bacterium]